MKPGYFKGKLRPCPFCRSDAIFTKDKYVMCSNMEDCALNSGLCKAFETAYHWNARPAFDQAIHSLISAGLADETFFNRGNGPDDPFIKSESIAMACDLTGLTRDEALEIYKQRQEEA